MSEKILADRYHLVEQIGVGGMAIVYRAIDQRTGHNVAVKVLRPEFNQDAEFVSRFQREAEAASKMTHHNIVNLLDVGMDGENRYLVMEYVQGKTLKKVIQEKGRISPPVAAQITIRILSALQHAHQNGIIHRDIKPQNILVHADGHIKVADFGIARMANSSTLTKGDSVMGSVHYFSPEQASGQAADVTSDIYSVGVVLYEMLTGHVPFDGDTTISVALKHVNEQPASMRSRNSHISRALDEVVMRALCKDKQLRYQSAAEMAADLRMTISHPRGGFVHYPAKREEAPQEIVREEPKKHAQQQSKLWRKRLQRWLIVVTTAVLVCALAALGIALQERYATVNMPFLIGETEEDAVQTMESLGVTATVVNAYSDDYAAGTVMLQSREPGEAVRKSAKITLTVSLGSQWYYLEDLTGWSEEDARATLVDAGVRSVEILYVQSDRPVGSVVSMNLSAGWQSRDSEVVLKVSGQCVSVPSLSGLTLEGAQAVIEAEGLVLGTVSEGDSADARSGAVIAQSIAPYTQVLTGTAVDLTLCRAQEIRYSPDAPLTLVVPLNNLRVSVSLITPSGASMEVYREVLPEGTHAISLTSSEQGLHQLYIYMDDVLYESMQLEFD